MLRHSMLRPLTPIRRFARALDVMEQNNMDTSKLIEAVRQERDENAALRTLLKGNTDAWKSTSSQLADLRVQADNLQKALDAALATTNNNEKDEQIAALKVQVSDLQNATTAAQADVDQAVNELSADNADTAQAITDNTVPAPAPETPPADTGSTGSIGGTSATGGTDQSQQSSGDAPQGEQQPQQ